VGGDVSAGAAGEAMTHRQFTDSRRVTWEVWEVAPSHAERRRAERERRRSRRLGSERRGAIDGTLRIRISSELAHGWLCFQSEQEKRRLTPVPDGWEQLDDAGLERLLREATLTGRPRRRPE
jgi:hypothetical protein